MYIADSPSRAFLDESMASEEVTYLELSDYTDNLRVSPSRLALIERESSQDEVCKSHRHVILYGWPENSYDCDRCLGLFFQYRGELIVQGSLIFRGFCLFVPSALRRKKSCPWLSQVTLVLVVAYVVFGNACSGLG